MLTPAASNASSREEAPLATGIQTTTTNIYPFMSYEDAPAAIEWLVAAFGFEAIAVYPGEDGTINHAELRLGDGGWVMLSTARDDRFNLHPPRTLGASSQGIAAYVDDIDAHYQRAKAAGAEMVDELSDTDYGARGYTARDPEGHLWSFGNYRPGQPPVS
jgi:uncharacterized glyoxalase superfamily protein PhnB